jgi:ribonuclease E
MPHKMLINATQPEEIRVAIISDNNKLLDLDLDYAELKNHPGAGKKKGNIYKATVTRIERSLNAIFVEYGAKKQGFLPLKEIAPEYLSQHPSTFDLESPPPITSLIKEGAELLIQIDKEERGNKGAALTTYITLAGCYLVLMPNNPDSGGISRRIEGDEREELRETLNALTLEDTMGIIIRTAGLGRSQEELQADLNMLLNQWQAIQKAYQTHLAPCLIQQEDDVIIRSIRDNLRGTIDEVIIDDHVAFTKARHYVEQIKPSFLPNVKLYQHPVPLFIQYQVENQIESAYKREVLLPSGGSLVIDKTEALISIDINSAKSTSGSDIETTAYHTNLEAADEIARQLRLRDLGGLVVIDFIDMNNSKHQREVETRLKEASSTDRARIQIGRISRFGLLEMSRERLRPSLGEIVQERCPRCEGKGTVRNIPSQALSIVRLIEEEALKEKTYEIHVQLPVEMATFLMNEKRSYLATIEKRHGVAIIIIANPYLQTPQYTINRIRDENASKQKKPSYSLIENPEIALIRLNEDNKSLTEPVVKSLSTLGSTKPQPTNIIKRLWSTLFGAQTEEESRSVKETKEKPTKSAPQQRRHHNKPRHHANQNNGQPRQPQRRSPTQQQRPQQNKNKSKEPV